ncbi:MAG TPA: hypothetical protein VF307_06265 [Candidatus Nanopelagicaceae bacterium]
MAITSLAPSVTRVKQLVAERPSRSTLRLVPTEVTKKQVDHKYFVAFVSFVGVLGLLMLLAINTLLAQDAFKLHKLQLQVQTLSDQREAVVREITLASSPEELAAHAQALGMVASQSPRFLTLTTSPINPARTKG